MAGTILAITGDWTILLVLGNSSLSSGQKIVFKIDGVLSVTWNADTSSYDVTFGASSTSLMVSDPTQSHALAFNYNSTAEELTVTYDPLNNTLQDVLFEAVPNVGEFWDIQLTGPIYWGHVHIQPGNVNAVDIITDAPSGLRDLRNCWDLNDHAPSASASASGSASMSDSTSATPGPVAFILDICNEPDSVRESSDDIASDGETVKYWIEREDFIASGEVWPSGARVATATLTSTPAVSTIAFSGGGASVTFANTDEMEFSIPSIVGDWTAVFVLGAGINELGAGFDYTVFEVAGVWRLIWDSDTLNYKIEMIGVGSASLTGDLVESGDANPLHVTYDSTTGDLTLSLLETGATAVVNGTLPDVGDTWDATMRGPISWGYVHITPLIVNGNDIVTDQPSMTRDLHNCWTLDNGGG
jgi:hypothetical protein